MKTGKATAIDVRLREDLEVSSLLRNEFGVRVGDTLMTAVVEESIKAE